MEVPALVDARGVHPQHVGALPEPFAAILRTQCEIVALATEAYRSNSRRVALQALLLDPLVTGIRQAEQILDTMLDLQRDVLPELR